MEAAQIKEYLIIAALAVFCVYYLSQLFGLKGRVQKAIDDSEGLDAAIDEALDGSDIMQESLHLQRNTLDEQRKTNLLLENIKTILETK